MFLFMDYYLKLITVHFLNYYLNLITVPVFGLLLELNQFLYLWFITCWWKDPYSVMGSSPVAYPPNREKSVLYTYLTNYFITVAVSQDFLNYLFHESNPSGPLINRLKWFYFKVYFHGNIRKICDSVEANTARTPPHANTAQSQQLNFPKIQKWLILRRFGLPAG